MDVIVFVLQVLFIIWAIPMIGLCVLFIVYAVRGDSDPYPPEAAQAPDPVEQAFTDVQRIVSDRLPSSTVDRLVRDFNWERYETWLKEPS